MDVPKMSIYFSSRKDELKFRRHACLTRLLGGSLGTGKDAVRKLQGLGKEEDRHPNHRGEGTRDSCVGVANSDAAVL